MNPLFEPRSIAVIGASPTPGKIGHVLMRNLATFPGTLYPVHPSAREVLGYRAYASVGEISQQVDLALLAVPQGVVISTVRECAKSGVGAVVVYSGGWAEAGQQGSAAQAELTQIARESGMRVLGPNTSGFVNPKAGIFASFVADLPKLTQPGGVAVVAQSGGVNISLCFLAGSEGLGIRVGIGLGNSSDLQIADVLEWLGEDADTKVVALAIEGTTDGHRLVQAVRQLSNKCPVVALTTGQTDVSEFAKSHTGVLSGSYRVKRAALAQAGAVVVDNLTELLDAVKALEFGRLPARQEIGVGIVTGQAGPGLLLTDAIRARKLPVPTLDAAARERISSLLPPLTYQQNPVDTGRPGATFGDVLKAVQGSSGIDVLAVSLIHEPDAVNPAEVLRQATPCVLCSLAPQKEYEELRASLRAQGVPVFPTPERAATAVAALATDSKHRWRKAASGSDPGVTAEIPRTVRVWNEATAKDLLDELRIQTLERHVARSHEEAHAALIALRPPVAAKILHPDVLHKTEAGGVHLNIRTVEELDAALRTIDRTPGAQYLIERMADPGPELLIGARRDPSFGPMVVLGSGGLETEAEADVAIRLAPVGSVDAHEMLDDLNSAFRYRGYRGGPVIDENALADIIRTIGQLIVSREDITEIEINPLRVTHRGLVALDAVVIGR